MEAAGYHPALYDGIIYFLVRDEDRHWLPILSVPVNPTDNYGIYRYLTMIESASQGSAAHPGPLAIGLDELGPTTRRLVERLKSLSRAHPRLAAAAKKAICLLRVA
jgi:hypothetical protein